MGRRRVRRKKNETAKESKSSTILKQTAPEEEKVEQVGDVKPGTIANMQSLIDTFNHKLKQRVKDLSNKIPEAGNSTSGSQTKATRNDDTNGFKKMANELKDAAEKENEDDDKVNKTYPAEAKNADKPVDPKISESPKKAARNNDVNDFKEMTSELKNAAEKENEDDDKVNKTFSGKEKDADESVDPKTSAALRTLQEMGFKNSASCSDALGRTGSIHGAVVYLLGRQ